MKYSDKIFDYKAKIIAAVIITIAVEGCTAKTSNSTEIEKTSEASPSAAAKATASASSVSTITASPSADPESSESVDSNNQTSSDSGKTVTDTSGCAATYHPAVTHVVHHDAVTHQETVTVPAVTHQATVVDKEAYTEGLCVCSGCGQSFESEEAWEAHSDEYWRAGNKTHTSWYYDTREVPAVTHEETVVDSPETTSVNTVVDSPAWDETVTDSEAYTGC